MTRFIKKKYTNKFIHKWVVSMTCHSMIYCMWFRIVNDLFFLNEFNWKATTFNDWHSSIEYCLTLSYGNLILLSRTLTLCIVLFIYVFFLLLFVENFLFLHFCVSCAAQTEQFFLTFFPLEFSYFFFSLLSFI